jgi:hypothetical protein
MRLLVAPSFWLELTTGYTTSRNLTSSKFGVFLRMVSNVVWMLYFKILDYLARALKQQTDVMKLSFDYGCDEGEMDFGELTQSR